MVPTSCHDLLGFIQFEPAYCHEEIFWGDLFPTPLNISNKSFDGFGTDTEMSSEASHVSLITLSRTIKSSITQTHRIELSGRKIRSSHRFTNYEIRHQNNYYEPRQWQNVFGDTRHKGANVVIRWGYQDDERYRISLDSTLHPSPFFAPLGFEAKLQRICWDRLQLHQTTTT